MVFAVVGVFIPEVARSNPVQSIVKQKCHKWNRILKTDSPTIVILRWQSPAAMDGVQGKQSLLLLLLLLLFQHGI